LLLLLLQAFVAGLPVRALRGVGFKSESVLRGWGVVTAGDAAALSKQMLVQGLGEKQGESAGPLSQLAMQQRLFNE
jgi:nucleotidyltransferase/DNA polymerase involved in DNA repair